MSKMEQRETVRTWIALSGICYSMWLWGGSLKCLGILLNEFEELFNLESIGTTTVSSVFTASIAIATVIGGCLADCLHLRWIYTIVTVLMISGHLIGGFTTNFTILIVGYALLFGMGIGIFASSTSVNIVKMFKKHRHLALGIYFSMSGLGSVTMPLLYTVLIQEYTVRGLLVIMAGLWLNMFLTIMLLEAPGKYGEQKLNKPPIFSIKIQELSGSERTNKEIYSNKCRTDAKVANAVVNRDHPCKPISCLLLKRRCKKILHWLKMIHPAVFWPFTLLMIFSQCAYISAFYQLPAYALESGLELLQRNTVITILGATELVARIVFGKVADLQFSRISLLIILFLLSASALLSMSMIDQNWTPYMIAVCIGLLGGIQIVFATPIVAELLKPRKVGKRVAVITFLSFLSVALLQPLFGVVRSISGSTRNGLLICGCLYVTAAVIGLYLRLFKKVY